MIDYGENPTAQSFYRKLDSGEKNIKTDVRSNNESIKNTVNELENSMNCDKMLEIYWSYFQLHSTQRMKILDLFIKVQICLFAAYYYVDDQMYRLKYMCAITISVVGLLCYLLDRRTTDLIHHVRVIFRKYEKIKMAKCPDEMKLFTSIKKNEGMVNYSKIIRFVYGLSVCVGFAMFIYALNNH